MTLPEIETAAAPVCGSASCNTSSACADTGTAEVSCGSASADAPACGARSITSSSGGAAARAGASSGAVLAASCADSTTAVTKAACQKAVLASGAGSGASQAAAATGACAGASGASGAGSVPAAVALAAPTSELLTPEQLALRLSVSRRCLGNWTRDRIIPMVKVGRVCRFDLPQVMAALEKYTQGPATR